jgi:antitoxin component YwqK of YwqJK toxin-antitoxin module
MQKTYTPSFILPLLALLLCLSATSFQTLSAQEEVVYLDAQLQETKRRKATYVRELTKVNDQLFSSRVTTKDGLLKYIGAYKFDGKKLLEHGEFVFYHANGKVESRGRYENGVKVGSWERYTASGQRKADRYYDPESAATIRDVMGK